jgi:hypothetical protein
MAGSAALLAGAALTFATAAIAQEGQDPTAVTAVFKAKEVDFSYRSSTAFLPCHQLRNVVTNILRAIGARDDIQVRVSDCEHFEMAADSGFDRWDDRRFPNRQFSEDGFPNNRTREQYSHIRARLMTPVELTPEVLAEIDKDKSRRELVSRVTGNPAAAMNDPIVFEAKRQPVTLSRTSLRLEPQDCQLLEQMTRSVFRELDVRVVRRNFTCDSRQESRIAPQMTVEALLPTGALRPMPEPESEHGGEKPETPSASDEAAQATPAVPSP